MKKLTTGLIGLLLALVLCVSLLPAAAQAADAPSVTTWNIALKDNIVVNFNVNVPDVANTTISATVNGAAVETSQSVSGNTCTVSVPLAAAQLSDSVKLLYNVNGTQSESREYTVAEYASYILNGNFDVAVKQITNQLLHYGAAAQNYFNYNTGALANAGVENIYADITMPTDVPAVSVTDNLDKVTYIGTSLVFRSQVYTRFYFKMDDRNTEINNYTVTINGQDCLYGKFYDPQGRFNYFADSPGITPNNYDQQLKVVITNTVDNSTMTVSYSPLNYIVNKSSSSTANLPELMKAMYGYHVESCEYMNYENAAATTFGSATGYGQNGIAYDGSSNVDLIFALANTNSAPEEKDYYPQSANCIMLKRGDSDPIPVADIEKPVIRKRSADAYHIYAQNLTVELQNQDVLIVAGNFSDDRDDIYKVDCKTVKIATAYVYVDLSYEKAATITSAEPVLWQTIDVGPFYNHTNTNIYDGTNAKPYRYMAAVENNMPYDGGLDSPNYKATESASLTLVQNGVPMELSTEDLGIKKYDATGYYIEHGVYDTTTLQNGDYFILKGTFRCEEKRIDINVAETYIYRHSDCFVFISETLPTTINAGEMKSHGNSHAATGIYFKMANNEAPYSDWSIEYSQTSADNLKLIRNGEEISIGLGGRPLIVKYGEEDYFLKLEKWSIGDIYGINGGSAPITTDDILIIEGDFAYAAQGTGVILNVTKSYIYYDGGKWVCSAAAPKVVDVVHLESHPTNGWNSTSSDGDGGMYFTAKENTAPYDGEWRLRYTPTSIDAIKLIRNGVETSIANTDAETIVKYGEAKYHLEFWPFANAKPMLPGDILIIDGWFYNKANNIYIDVEKTYFTLFADGTIACTKVMPVSHTVILNADDGTGSTTSLSTTTGGKVTLPTPTRTHYTFNGWSDGTNTYAGGASYTVNGDVTLTALWTINQYTVSYNHNGGDGSTASETVIAGTEITLPAAPTRTHYTFNGWSDGTTTYQADQGYTVNGNVTLTAQWTPIVYTVTYDYNGGSGSPASATGTVVTAVTLPTPATRSGYRFNGWFTAASGGTKIGDANASYAPTGDVTLHAQWIAQYTVTYDINGGNSTTPSSQTVDAGQSINLPAAPTHKSKSFKGWYDKSSGGNRLGGANDPYTPTASIKIYAQWESCLAEGTLITMADGTLKAIEDIVVGDEVLTWNFINGTYEIVPVSLALDDGAAEYTILTLSFDDGAALRIIDEHGIFDADLNEYAYINAKNVSEYIGHTFVKLNADGSVATTKLTGYSLSTEVIGCYTLQTAFNVNCVAEGLLTQTPPLCEGYFDYFEMGDFMQYDQEQMQADIETYGLYTYEDFQDYLTYDAFIAFNGPYLKVAVGKGYFTFEYLIEQIKAFGIGIE
ncbi:MAG: InlB B-repeat-containing protein [Oscillospiraceae bacterium]|nr:InlB B-repeat-containing protein [Oscillospiraceae bacterium]